MPELEEDQRNISQVHNYTVGDAVQVFSKSNNEWCDGKVVCVNDGNVLVEYVSKSDARHLSKHLPASHPDVQLVNNSQTEVLTTREYSEVTQRESPEEEIVIGSDIMVFSKTHKKWVLGKVVTKNGDRTITVEYAPSGSEIKRKVLEVHNKDLKRDDPSTLSSSPAADRNLTEPPVSHVEHTLSLTVQREISVRSVPLDDTNADLHDARERVANLEDFSKNMIKKLKEFDQRLAAIEEQQSGRCS